MTRNQEQYLSGLADSKFKVILHGHVPVCDGHPFPAVQSVGITSGPGAIGGLPAPFRADKAASQDGFSEQIDQVIGVQQQFLKVRSALFRPDLDATGAQTCSSFNTSAAGYNGPWGIPLSEPDGSGNVPVY